MSVNHLLGLQRAYACADNRVYFIVIASLSLIPATLEWYIANVPVILASLEFKVIGSFINDNELAEG